MCIRKHSRSAVPVSESVNVARGSTNLSGINNSTARSVCSGVNNGAMNSGAPINSSIVKHPDVTKYSRRLWRKYNNHFQ